MGVIKWLRQETGLPASMRQKDPGWGYIACRETYKMFERDVWAYPAQLQGYKVGDVVSFKVSIDHWYSWPVALNIQPAVAPLPYVSVATVSSPQECAGSRPVVVEPDVEAAAAANCEFGESHAAATVATPCRSPLEAPRPSGPQEDWQRFSQPDGQGYWWWRAKDGDFFLEDSPEPWAKYTDPDTGKPYWWKNDDVWFWAS